MSFAAIQQQERDRNALPAEPKKSLVQIQAEEAQREAERQAEEEFMRWWNAEEARVKAEEAETLRRLSGPAKPPAKAAKKRSSKPKGNPPAQTKGRAAPSSGIEAA